MARPQKKGLDYFPFDVDFFTDTKVEVLKGSYGIDGVMLYIYLLTLIYKENGYYLKMDNDMTYVIAGRLNMSHEKIGQIINFLLERSLFDKILFKSDKVLTSHGIQIRFQEAVKTRGTKTAIEIEPRFWVLKENETKSYIKCTHFSYYSKNNDSFSKKNDNCSIEEVHKVKESKVKKSIVKESNNEVDILSDVSFSPTVKNKVSEWLCYKKERKDSYKPTGLKSLLTIVEKNIKTYGEQPVIDIIDLSIANGWKGIIWDRISKPSPQNKNYEVFQSNQYDYDEIERQMWENMKKK